jgi:ribosomal protein S18 acetylase RimI-like enzyme
MTSARFRDGAEPDDREVVCGILDRSGFFDAAEIEIAGELVDEFVARGEASGYHFLFLEDGEGVAGYACFGPIPMTRSSWDLYWIAVDPRRRGRGLGREILREVEGRAAARGCEQLFVETAGRPQYEPTRAFYRACGYRVVAELPDFYSPGDAKVIFARRLA